MKLLALTAMLLLSPCALAQPLSMEEVALKLASEPLPKCSEVSDRALSAGAITLLPGDTICVSLDLRGDKAIPVAIVDHADPRQVLILRLWQQPGSEDSYLFIRNPLGSYLRYKAYLLRPDSTQREYTSSCPVLSQRFGLEHWPYPISELTLAEFTTEPETDRVACK